MFSLLFCPACFPRPVRVVLTTLVSLSESLRLTEVKTRPESRGWVWWSWDLQPGWDPRPRAFPHVTPPLDLMGVGAV